MSITLQSIVGEEICFVDGMAWPMEKNTDSKTQGNLETWQMTELEALLEEFAVIFKEPEGLPSERSITLSINLLPRTEQISVRPYRYPHYQKDEIERQIKTMLAQGIIRNSTSSFSGQVILVRKKDNSGRMCTDYRALNKATVQDKYPIHVVEELFNELIEAHFFSKLDSKSGYHQIRMTEGDVHKTAFMSF